MRKRFIITLLSLICTFGCIFFAACASGGANENPKGEVTAPVESSEEVIKKLQQQIAALQKENEQLSDKIMELEDKNEFLSNDLRIYKNQSEARLAYIRWFNEVVEKLTDGEDKPVLDEAKAEEIKTTHYVEYKDAYEKYALTSYDISIRFYGEYNNSYVMFIDSPIFIYIDYINFEPFDDVIFVYGSTHKLCVYNNGIFYTVGEAYNHDLLTHDDLLDISYKLNFHLI